LGLIFDSFDADDRDGLISSHKINFESQSFEILHIFAPILEELDQLDEDLNKEDFIEASLGLVKTLDIQSKNLILNFSNHMHKKNNF